MKQILSPPSQFAESRFSSILRSDRNTSTLAIGCPYCNVTIYAGQVYLYQQGPDKSWINTQVLTAKYVDYLKDPKSAAFFLGGLISLDRNVLLTSVLTYRNGNDFIWGCIVFSHSTSTGSWSQQQTITSAIYDSTTMTVVEKNIDVFAVHDETIVFSTVGQPYQGIAGVGAVSILYPNTKRFTAPYTATPTILTSHKSTLLTSSTTAAKQTNDYSYLRSSTAAAAAAQENMFTEELFRLKLTQDHSLSPKPTRKSISRGHESHRNPGDDKSKTKTHSFELDDNLRSVLEEKLGFKIPQKIETQSHETSGSFQEFELTTEGNAAARNSLPRTKSQQADSSSSKLTSRGLSWSTRQILYPPVLTSSLVPQSNFGSDLSIYRDTLIIGEQGTSRVYYYSRQSSSSSSSSVIGLWSHQQTLLPSQKNVLFYSDNYLSNSYLITLGLISTPGTSQLTSISMDFRISSQDWKCLLLSLEDTFGDGWGDDVYLTLTTPLGKRFSYTMIMSSFETPNPFVIRYCPDELEYDHFLSLSSASASSSTSSSVTTTYLIEIDRGNQSIANIGPFFWEIQYRTQIEGSDEEEGTAGVVYGNYGTKVTYTFNWETKSFEYLSSSRALPSPSSSSSTSSCESCRVYSQSEITYSALVSDESNWRYLNMFTNTPSLPWYNQHDSYHSTNYFLSDIFGSKLIYSGTMCLEDINDPGNGNMHSCWLDIPSDGTYLLRISGALYTNPNTSSSSFSSPNPSISSSIHSWNFCHQTGDANSHIYFTISNSGLDCVINGIYPLEVYTSSDLQSFITIDGTLSIRRSSQSSPNGESFVFLTAADRSLFSQAIISVLSNMGTSLRDVAVKQEVYVPRLLDTHVNEISFTLILNLQTSSSTTLSLEEEYDGMKTKDFFYMQSLAEEVIEKIENGVMNGNILSVLQSTTLVPQSTFFGVQTLSVEVKEGSELRMREEITLIPAAPAKDEVSFY
jgi:hypothetical protein